VRRVLYDSSAPEYAAATQPHNAATSQQPAFVATPVNGDEVGEVMSAAEERGLVVVPQATGHGAGAVVGSDVLLLDTSRLSAISIDADARVASVGSGATWGVVNEAAQKHGLLGLAGSAPSVSVSGYSFAGGIGWLVRRDGLASGALRRVHYVDGAGRSRIAADDAPGATDRDAMWAFRGAGGVGVATTLEVDLFPARTLHAGKLLWHVDALDAVVDAWLSSLDSIARGVATSIAILHVLPVPLFPEELHGKVAVHLAVADPDGGEEAEPLIAAVRAAAVPVTDDWGPADAARLAQIHLDPPDAVPAIGDARWLDASATLVAADLLRTASAADSPLVMMELRHVGGAGARRAGALTSAPAPFVYHSVGVLGRSTRAQLADGFARARHVWTHADAGLTPGSWVEGAAAVSEALPGEVLTRARAVADDVDPRGRIRRPRLLGGAAGDLSNSSRSTTQSMRKRRQSESSSVPRVR
jgi:FAD/FMN-containing dehydrogenase